MTDVERIAEEYAKFRAEIKMPPTREQLLDACLWISPELEPITHKNPTRARGAFHKRSFGEKELSAHKYKPKEYAIEPGELRLKVFLMQEATRLKCSWYKVRRMIKLGEYPGLTRRKIGGAVFVNPHNL